MQLKNFFIRTFVRPFFIRLAFFLLSFTLIGNSLQAQDAWFHSPTATSLHGANGLNILGGNITPVGLNYNGVSLMAWFDLNNQLNVSNLGRVTGQSPSTDSTNEVPTASIALPYYIGNTSYFSFVEFRGSPYILFIPNNYTQHVKILKINNVRTMSYTDCGFVDILYPCMGIGACNVNNTGFGYSITHSSNKEIYVNFIAPSTTTPNSFLLVPSYGKILGEQSDFTAAVTWCDELNSMFISWAGLGNKQLNLGSYVFYAYIGSIFTKLVTYANVYTSMSPVLSKAPGDPKVLLSWRGLGADIQIYLGTFLYNTSTNLVWTRINATGQDIKGHFPPAIIPINEYSNLIYFVYANNNTDHYIFKLKNFYGSYSNWISRMFSSSTPLKRITFPGSHDAGMSIAHSCSSIGVVSGNSTITQRYSIASQLREGGSRFFDLRPAGNTFNNIFNYHGSLNGPILGLYCKGEGFFDVVNSINSFLDDNPEEFVISSISHFEDGSKEYLGDFLSSVSYGRRVFRKPGIYTINQLMDMPLSELKGKWIIFSDDANFVRYNSVLYEPDWYGHHKWVESFSISTNINGQRQWLIDNQNNTHNFKRLYWTRTPGSGDAVSMELPVFPSASLLVQSRFINDQLESTFNNWKANGTFNRQNLPQVIYTDDCNADLSKHTLSLNFWSDNFKEHYIPSYQSAMTAYLLPTKRNTQPLGTGSLTAKVMGGLPPYTYYWYQLPSNTTDSLPNIHSGYYQVLITDSRGKKISKSLNVNFASPDLSNGTTY